MKDIPRYENLYAVTRDGRVWSHPKTWTSGRGSTSHNHEGRWLVPYKKTNGYITYSLTYPQGTSKEFRAHRLVAITYIPKPNDAHQVNHIDGNKENNSVDNLEWVTPRDNIDHAINLGLRKRFPIDNSGERNFSAKLTASDVLEIRRLHRLGVNANRLSKQYSVYPPTIWAILKRRTWKHLPS